jgi:hypothetical protein
MTRPNQGFDSHVHKLRATFALEIASGETAVALQSTTSEFVEALLFTTERGCQ